MSHPENVGLILWAKNHGAHQDHLHVEPDHTYVGWTDGRGEQPPTKNLGPTPELQRIIKGLIARFGTMKYFKTPGKADWTNMGVRNRRAIAGSSRWSQHAWSNAIDIGPYVGITAQQGFYEFLTGREAHPGWERIGGYRWHDVDQWPTWADAAIRSSIVSGLIRGRQFTSDPLDRVYDADRALTRAEMAAILSRMA